MAKFRFLSGHFNHSFKALDELRNHALNDKKLCMHNDVATRWWSTYLFAKRIVELKDVLTDLIQKLKINVKFDFDDWDYLSCLVDVLAPFKEAQEPAEGNKYVTNSMVFYQLVKINNALDKFQSNSYPNKVRDLAVKMSKGLHKTFGDDVIGHALEDKELSPKRSIVGMNKSHLIAMFLDPRTKELMSVSYDHKDAIKKLVEDECTQLLIEESGLHEIDDDNKEVNNEGNCDKDGDFLNNNDINFDEEDENDINDIIEISPSTNEPPSVIQLDPLGNILEDGINDIVSPTKSDFRGKVRFEMAKFINEPTLMTATIIDNKKSYCNPLEWWRKKQLDFPSLTTLARKYLCIPATSAPVERVFSSGSNIITKRRSCLDVDRASDLIFLHDSKNKIETICNSKRINNLKRA